MTFGEQNTEKESHEMLSYAIEEGINCIDTAEAVRFYLNCSCFSTCFVNMNECKCLNVLYFLCICVLIINYAYMS